MITVIIPTYNHPKYIDYILKHSFSVYKGKLFRFSIHDSSEDDSTEKLIQAYNENHDNQIAYFRYPSDISGDFKSYTALKETNSDYLYLMGDGLSPDYDALESTLIENKYDRFDFVGVLPSGYRDIALIKNKYQQDDHLYGFSDLIEFASQFFYMQTLYGGSIVSHRIIDYIDENNIFERYKYDNRYCYAYISSVFTALSMNSKFTFCSSFVNCLLPNVEKKGNWAHGDNLYKILFEEFQNDVKLLPSYFDDIKQQILLSRNIFAWKKIDVIHYRKIDSLNFKYLKKYKSVLRVCTYNYRFAVFACFIPRFILILMSNVKKGIKRLMK